MPSIKTDRNGQVTLFFFIIINDSLVVGLHKICLYRMSIIWMQYQLVLNLQRQFVKNYLA